MKLGLKKTIYWFWFALVGEFLVLLRLPKSWRQAGRPEPRYDQTPDENYSQPNENSIGTSRPNPRPLTGDLSKTANKYSFRWFKERLEVVAILTAVILVYLTYRQSSATEGQLKVMQTQLFDSEMQQRAILKIEKFEFKRMGDIVWGTGMNSNFGQIVLDQTVLIKNYGATPAVDIAAQGQIIPSGLEELWEKNGMSNIIQRWDSRKIRKPLPGSGGTSIMAQETFTNTTHMTLQVKGESLYIELWFSYRDIFGNPYIIGEAGKYVVSNDTFLPEMLYPVRLSPETNKAAQ